MKNTEICCTGLVEHELGIIESKIEDGIRQPCRCYLCKRTEGSNAVYFADETKIVKLELRFVTKLRDKMKIKFLLCRDCATLLSKD